MGQISWDQFFFIPYTKIYFSLPLSLVFRQSKDSGEISMNKLTARYPVRGEICLKELTLTIKAGEKVGLVGRTGAGKSSMALLMFRLLDRIGGSLNIDSEDVNKMNLARHRSRITIIPQVSLLGVAASPILS